MYSRSQVYSSLLFHAMYFFTQTVTFIQSSMKIWNIVWIWVCFTLFSNAFCVCVAVGVTMLWLYAYTREKYEQKIFQQYELCISYAHIHSTHSRASHSCAWWLIYSAPNTLCVICFRSFCMVECKCIGGRSCLCSWNPVTYARYKTILLTNIHPLFTIEFHLHLPSFIHISNCNSTYIFFKQTTWPKTYILYSTLHSLKHIHSFIHFQLRWNIASFLPNEIGPKHRSFLILFKSKMYIAPFTSHQ